MTEWKDIERLVYKILYSEFKDYDLSLLGESYIVFDKCVNNFDETKNVQFTTYFCSALRMHLIDYLKADKLIYIPRLKRNDISYSMVSLCTPLKNDVDGTVEDLIASDIETDSDAICGSIISIINSLKFNDREQECLDCMIAGRPYPREYRAYASRVREKIANAI